MDDKYLKKKYAIPIQETLVSCGLINQEIGVTFTADHTLKDGSIAESAIDHVYVSSSIVPNVNTRKIINYASDHFPVIISYETKISKPVYTKKIIKRSLKNFSVTNWNNALQSQDWSDLYQTNDLNEAVDIYTKKVEAALDDIAPINL